MSLEVWCSLSQCHASSGASVAAAEPAPTQVQDLEETTHTHSVKRGAAYTSKDGKVVWLAANNNVQGPASAKSLPRSRVLQHGNEALIVPG